MALNRRMATTADMELLFELSKRAMKRHVESTFGAWDESDQRRRFFESTDPAAHELIYHDATPIGFTCVQRKVGFIELERISIVPEFQGRGIGTKLIRELTDEATSSGELLRLQVFVENPARKLYERLGFSEVGRTQTHVLMEWRPNRE